MIIVKYGEIALKGGNRGLFEKKLQHNIKDCLKKNNVPFRTVTRYRGRILIDCDKECKELADVFGIVSFSNVQEVELNLDKMKEVALNLYREGSFRVSCKRGEKIFMKSPEIERELGAYVVENNRAKVNLTKPDCTIFIEIFHRMAYMYNEKIKGLGGLPVGIQGRVGLLLQDETSIDAGLKLMKRGCNLLFIKENDVDTSALNKYKYGFSLKEGKEEDVIAIVVNDTLDNLRDYGDKLVLRPLI